MTDPATGLPADNIPESLAAGDRSRLHLADQHRRLPVVDDRRPRARHHHAAASARARLDQHAHDAAADGAPRAERHVLQLVRRGDRRGHCTPGPTTAAASTRSSPASTTAGSAPPCSSCSNADRARPPARPPAVRPDALGRVLRRRRDHGPPRRAPRRADARRLLRLRRRPPGRRPSLGTHIGGGPDVWLDHPPLRHDRVRDPDHELPRHPHRPGPGASTTSPRGAPSRRPATGRGTRCSRSAQTRTYLGIDVFEGAYTYRGMHIVPGWGGSMFEELMPDVFVPEASWAPRSWGVNHPLHVRAQREHGLDDAGYGYWGFSPVEQPGRRLPRVRRRRARAEPRRLLLRPGEDQPRRRLRRLPPGDQPEPDLRRRRRHPARVVPRDDVRARRRPTANLVGIQDELGAYGRGGFFDAVAVRSGTIARRYLSLDQAMVMGALGNVLGDGVLRTAFSTPAVEKALRPVIGIEQFGAGSSALSRPRPRRVLPPGPGSTRRGHRG